jgi:hypothetical protein
MALLSIGIFSYKFFGKLLQTTICLDHHYLIKNTELLGEKYPLSDISSVKIKWTTQKTIREIYIWLKEGKAVFITALDNFIGFKDELLEKLDKQISIKEIHEPIKYDHPLFYVLLGLLIGISSVFGFKSLIQFDNQTIKVGTHALFIYTVVLGIYFFIAKPIAKRSGEKTKTLDYIAGSTLIILGILVYLLMFRYI